MDAACPVGQASVDGANVMRKRGPYRMVAFGMSVVSTELQDAQHPCPEPACSSRSNRQHWRQRPSALLGLTELSAILLWPHQPAGATRHKQADLAMSAFALCHVTHAYACRLNHRQNEWSLLQLDWLRLAQTWIVSSADLLRPKARRTLTWLTPVPHPEFAHDIGFSPCACH